MNGYNDVNHPLKPGRPWLIIAAAALILTAAIIAGIKFFIGSDGQDLGSADKAATGFKFQDKSGLSQGYNPIARSETGTGGSLEMFAKTNAGYSREDSSSTESGAAAAEGPKVKKPAESKKGVKTKPAAASRKHTVIPKMQAMKAFGTAAGASNANAPQGAAMPDISNLIKQARQKQGK